MHEVADESVHLVITSPPYWQLKDYDSDNQIGFSDTYEEYVNSLNLVWQECQRVLHNGCRLCINIGDQFARSLYYGRYKVIPIRTEIIRLCETIGLDYMGAVIWQKVTTCNTTGGATVMGSFPHPRNGVVKIDYEFILIFKKQGKAPQASKSIKEESRLTTQEWNQYFSGHWNFPGEKQDRHLAMFPEELPKRLIRMFTFVGETVLDPFLGSGTTSLAARNQGRNSIGYEINADFVPGIEKKLGIREGALFQDADFEVVRRGVASTDFTEQIARLPYRFRDPVAIDRKVDPKKHKFGSRIDAHSTWERQKYHKVKQVASPEILVLDSGQRVRLLGIRESQETSDSAVQFLRTRTSGQKVSMEFDETKFDEEGNLLCYLYFKNRTFLNLHLVRTGLVEVDTSRDYRFKSKFLSESENSTWQKSGS